MTSLTSRDAEIATLMARAKAQAETAALMQAHAEVQRDAGNHALAYLYRHMALGQAHGQLCDELAASAIREGV